MRIGQFTDSFLPVVDGVGRVLESYAETLSDMGQDVTVFAPWTRAGELGNRRYRVVTYNTLSVPKFQYRVGVPGLDVRFDLSLKRTELDIVHVHSPFMLGRVGLRVAKRRGLPVVATFHSKYYDDFKQVLKADRLARFGTKQVVAFFEQCDEVWAVTEASAATLREYGYRGDVVVMPNGTNIRALDETVLPELRARFGIRQDVPLLLYVGQMNWKKNIHQSLSALRLLKDEGIAFQMLLAGVGPHQADIQATVEAMGLSDSVRLIGHIVSTRDLDGLYALSRLFVFPSLYDNGPMVLREAAAMGTPTLLIEGSSAAECVKGGVNGFTCEDTKESLRDALKLALADEALSARVGEAARGTIPVSWQTLMEQVVARYEALLRRKRNA